MKKKLLKHAHKKHRKHAGHHVLGTYGVIATALVSVVALGGVALISASLLRSGEMAAVISAALVDLTNTERSQEKLGSLTVSPVLQAAAQAKADDMAKNGYFAHTSPDGKTPWYWFKQVGYSFEFAGENLAIDFTDSDAVENAWMNSPTHRANILNAHYTEIGIATAEGMYEGHPTTYVVQEFGTPATTPTGAVEAVNVKPAATEIAVAKTDVLGESVSKKSATTAPAATVNVAPITSSPVQPLPPAPQAPTGLLAMLVATPESLLRDLYILIGVMEFIALVSITGIEFKKHNLRYMFAAAFVLVLMVGLYVAADTLVFASPTLTASAAMSGF